MSATIYAEKKDDLSGWWGLSDKPGLTFGQKADLRCAQLWELTGLPITQQTKPCANCKAKMGRSACMGACPEWRCVKCGYSEELEVTDVPRIAELWGYRLVPTAQTFSLPPKAKPSLLPRISAYPAPGFTWGRLFFHMDRYQGQSRFGFWTNPLIVHGSLFGIIAWSMGITDPDNYTMHAKPVLRVK